jgi:hypothetical protein
MKIRQINGRRSLILRALSGILAGKGLSAFDPKKNQDVIINDPTVVNILNGAYPLSGIPDELGFRLSGYESEQDVDPLHYRWDAASLQNNAGAIRPPSISSALSPGRLIPAAKTLGSEYFGIIPDLPRANTASITRNTKRFQDAVEYCMNTVSLLQLPSGTIRINDSVRYNQQSGGSTFRGVSMRGTIIEQVTNNKPCFDITANLLNAAEFSNMQFQWAQNQPATNKDAVAIRFSGSCYASIFTKLFFNNGFRGIECVSAPPSASGTGSAWGNEYSHIWSTNMSGAVIALEAQVGSPQNDLRNIYVLGPNASEPFIIINAGLETTISTIELNINPNSQTFIYLKGGTYADIRGIRTETNTSPNRSSANPVFRFTDSQIVISQVELSQTINVGTGNYYKIFDGSNSHVTIQSLINIFTINSGKAVLFNGGIETHVTNIIDQAYGQHGGNKIIAPGCQVYDNSSANTAEKSYLYQQNRHRTIDRGDGDITLTEWDEFDHQRFTNPLTATRTVTFPSAYSENCQVGRRFKISKLIKLETTPPNGASGDLRCINVDGGAFIIPAATKGWAEFEYWRFGWKLIGSGSLL